jgi:hypothetical protein
MQSLQSLAEQNEIETRERCEDIKSNFLEVGRLIYANFLNAYWSQCGHESFWDYIEELGIGSQSWVSRLMGIVQCVDTKVLVEADVLEMGVTNAGYLLPAIHRGELTEDLVMTARTGSQRELRKVLGYKGNNNKDYSIHCPNCGEVIYGVKRVGNGNNTK